LPPPNDGWIADAVANAPGGPNPVLLSDSVAEHIPGCNMAFRKDALEAIGGFDPVFRTAGDDVDVCWRLRDRGGLIGYSPAAVVWHHRRKSIRKFWKQQVGYGKAEALLEHKWPARYNSVGQLSWRGRLYGKGVSLEFSALRGRQTEGLAVPLQPPSHRPLPAPSPAHGAPVGENPGRADSVEEARTDHSAPLSAPPDDVLA